MQFKGNDKFNLLDHFDHSEETVQRLKHQAVSKLSQKHASMDALGLTNV